MAKDLLIELGSEELPAGFVKAASASLRENLLAEFTLADLTYKSTRLLGTPRRTTVIVEGLSEGQKDKVVEVRGPALSVAYDNDTKEPTKALLGFCKSQGVDAKDLKTIKDGKREYVLAIKEVKGEATTALLPDIIKKAISKINFKKTMRWGERDMRFARPLHWILALFGDLPVKLTYGHIDSGNTTRGHRFMASKDPIEITNAGEYETKLKEAYVIVDPEKRRKIISDGIKKAAEEAGGSLLADKALTDEVTNLVEYPIVIRGGFDKEFLELPCDVIVDAMRSHQRYFSVISKDGGLKPSFITIANTEVHDEAVVRKGNERVLKARLSDAQFYFKKDTAEPLQSFVEGLKGVVFQAKLGTSYEKIERFTRLALHIGATLKFSAPLNADETPANFLDNEEVKEHIAKGIIDITTIGDNTEYNKYVIGRAAMLSKADLLSGIVGEFPSLQGVIGREYALLSNEAEEVADAILEHYRPVSAKADLPASEIGAIISIADKLDTIAGCFGVKLIPTGTSDPYALRRSALGIIAIIIDRGYRLQLNELVGRATCELKDKLIRTEEETQNDIMDFFKERLKNQLLGEDTSFDAIDAVLTTRWYDIVDAVARIKAIEDFKSNPACESLVALFKRVSNILKDQDVEGEVNPSLIEEDAERALYDAGQEIRPTIDKLKESGDYIGLFKELASVKDVVDTFFDKVMVMAEDAKIKENRLRLLSSMRELYIEVADISKIVAGE